MSERVRIEDLHIGKKCQIRTGGRIYEKKRRCYRAGDIWGWGEPSIELVDVINGNRKFIPMSRMVIPVE